VSATTAEQNAQKIVRGFDTKKPKGAGIRVYEYASSDTIRKCRVQVEALFWLCGDSEKTAVANGMTAEGAAERKATVINKSQELGLLDITRLANECILNSQGEPSVHFAAKSYHVRASSVEWNRRKVAWSMT